ncbi:hypothetical protein Poli38472_001003 [Pythium oligandrum]|uniref:Uncharacterized protein n=1 Tax=Pythium oligandrum TaxID=41045 RepID=A0A8K1FFV5_PYTOL|nr:hypothetical protein Poli38472_001003 [Pythium oligandrum]|eukprot:TMW60961.1 hypothetical protein Poli38472_001003 [Pythium oligandrum]
MSSTQTDAQNASINPSGTLKTSVTIYFTLLGVGLLLFECVRRRFRRAYDSRATDGNVFWTYTQSTLANRPFSWIWTVYQVSDDEILERCGLDILSFLRFLRMGQKVALLAVGLSAVLFPLYATSTPPPTSRKEVDPLERITMSNVSKGDKRLWASMVASYVVCCYTMYLLLLEYQHYVRRRHEMLSKTEAPMYTILVNDLPLKLRTGQTLEQYMHKLFPSTVRCVYVAVECSKLEEMVAERDKVRDALEHALALNEVKGTRPRHRVDGSWWDMVRCRTGSRGLLVDSIDHYQDTLAKLNEKVAREIVSIENAQAQLAQEVAAQEHGNITAPTMTQEEDENLAEHLQSQRHLEEGRKGATEMTATNSVDRESQNDHRQSVQAIVEDDEDEEESVPSGKEEDQTTRERSRREHPIRVMRRAAFISFTSLVSAQVAQQTLQSSNPVSMAITPAPHVDDVNWENIGLQYRTRAMGQLISSLITAAIVLFWTIPTAFVASLSTVESLRRALPFLNKAFDKYPILEEVFKQIAPLALVGLSALAPIIFRFLSAREGHPSITEVRAALFTKLAYFQLIQIFFVTVVVGTVMDSLKEIIDQPKTLISMLGRSMPQQSTFFMSYVIVLTGLGLVLELLRVVPIVLSLLFSCLAPQLTRRERNAKWYGLASISNTDAFDPTSTLADCFLVMLVTLTFATIAPLVCYFTGWFFFIAEVVYRRQILFVYKSTSFAMGAYWPRLYSFLIVALVVSQLTLVGLLSLKRAVTPTVLIFVLIVIILLFHHYVSSLFPRVAKYLPLNECVRFDELRSQRDPDRTYYFLDGVYQQPAMQQMKPLRADYRMLGEEDYERGAIVSSPEMHAEDQRLFSSDGTM